jgi:ribosomal protein S1
MNEDNISFEELLNNSMNKAKRLDKIVTGTVIGVSQKGEVYVDINYKADGIIPKTEFSFDENVNPADVVKAGDTITAEVKKLNDGEGNVLLSCKKIRKEEIRKKSEEKITNFWNEAKPGDKYDGVVSSVCSYGAFIDINGIQGLLHISEMSWDREAKAQDLLKPGQEIKVTIKEIDKDNKRMKLAYDEKGEDPWSKLDYKVGDIVKVKIKKIVPFGAFAELKKGIEGLIHISQICEQRIAKPEEKLEIGEKVNAKIIGLDLENKKIELSIKEIEGTSNEYSSKQN